MENDRNTQGFTEAFKSLILNSLINNYAVERVAFGYEKPGDKVPIEMYLKHLRLDVNDGLHRRSDITGIYIDEHECISAEQDRDGYVRDLFVYQAESIFMDAPKDGALERVGEELPLLPRFRDYLLSLLPMFSEILHTQVEYDCFDVIPEDRSVLSSESVKWQRFIAAVLIKPLKTGSRIDRYVKDFTTTPYFIKQLIEKRGGHHYLTTADIDSNDYKLALFSAMRFMNGENDRLLELKMREWAQAYKIY